MIITRYLASTLFKGSVLVLFIIISLSLFFTAITQLDNLGKGQFGGMAFTQYILLLAPGMMVYFLPIAVLLGSMLSLGSLASNSELIALQASGLSLRQLIKIVAQAVLVIAIFAFCLENFVVPYSETAAGEIKASAMASRISMRSKHGLWIKDGQNIVFIEQLFPDGNARNIEIYHLDDNNRLQMKTFAAKAINRKQGWLLLALKKTIITPASVTQTSLDSEIYKGKLSEQLLQSLVIDSHQMSILDLNSYINFLQQNHLNHAAESLSFWRKIYYPFTIIIMAIMTIPFVIGSQRNSNTGQRLMIGIMLGLGYNVLDKLLIQLGQHFSLPAVLNALLPTLLFVVLTFYLIRQKSMNR